MSSKIHVLSHPVINAKLSLLRKAETSSKEFRECINDISYILGIEATRDLEETTFEGQTTAVGAKYTGKTIAGTIGITPILRAGLGMTDALLNLLPSARLYHIGLFREKVSLQPVEYYSKLHRPAVDQCILLDPMVATGGTACAAIEMLLDWGLRPSKEGLRTIQHRYPNLEIWVAAVDDELTADGIVKPGLGDAVSMCVPCVSIVILMLALGGSVV
ncbi:hypothetical protein Clacol_001716 [Clathrus columnatus]|uniref:uracil phosphoribosyltransferase n=1 Tax=Clathrus columnatus TaxID=1419009 RepID=A0AAV4ZYV5_9AGAM|nr:hypothetical protein Clacol_001716 [Clathrus columnatus]